MRRARDREQASGDARLGSTVLDLDGTTHARYADDHPGWQRLEEALKDLAGSRGR
jgi:hypothetical protein